MGTTSTCCILSKFYIKPQRRSDPPVGSCCCILSKFYIKPQHYDFEKRINYVVSYRNSTSNHNSVNGPLGQQGLYLIEILHQTTTAAVVIVIGLKLYLIEILHQTTTIEGISLDNPSCILSKFYIKPQQPTVLLYPYLSCILSKFYIKPQPSGAYRYVCIRCILSKFYIKPQQSSYCLVSFEVVSYRNSTSNHNEPMFYRFVVLVVSYRNSTSNHNSFPTSQIY